MLRCLLSFLAPILVIGAATAEDIRIQTVGLAAGIAEITTDAAGGIVIRDDRDRLFVLSATADGPRLESLSEYRAVSPIEDDRKLPDGEGSVGRGAVAKAWLADPTDRYRHGVLGDAIEAATVRVQWRGGGTGEFSAGNDAVFEDRRVRLADVDGDGEDDLVVVHTYLDKGAAVLVLKADGGTLEVLGESPPIGQSHRWLNPVGVADFDGDRKPEIAVVTTPHIGGILRYYGYRRGRLVEELTAAGYSNHINGSRTLDMAAVLDLNGDTVPDILLPSDDRRRLVAVTANRGEITVLWELRHQAPVVTAVRTADLEDDGLADIVYGLQDGTLVLVIRRPATH
jgi:hypothetical protein